MSFKLRIGFWAIALLAFVGMAIASESSVKIIAGAGLMWFLGSYVIQGWLSGGEINFGWITIAANSSRVERVVYLSAGAIALLFSVGKLWGFM